MSQNIWAHWPTELVDLINRSGQPFPLDDVRFLVEELLDKETRVSFPCTHCHCSTRFMAFRYLWIQSSPFGGHYWSPTCRVIINRLKKESHYSYVAFTTFSLPSVAIPTVSLPWTVLVDSLKIAVVAFCISLSMAKALDKGYVGGHTATRELVADVSVSRR